MGGVKGTAVPAARRYANLAQGLSLMLPTLADSKSHQPCPVLTFVLSCDRDFTPDRIGSSETWDMDVSGGTQMHKKCVCQLPLQLRVRLPLLSADGQLQPACAACIILIVIVATMQFVAFGTIRAGSAVPSH